MSLCDACTGAGQDHDKIVALCKGSPYWTGRLLFGFDKMGYDLHRNLARWLVTRIAKGKRRFIIMTPRDHYKTTLFGVSTMMWFLLNNPEVRILYMMSSEGEAIKKLSVVKDALLTSDTMKHFFPKLVPDLSNVNTKWTANYVKVPYRKGRYAEGTFEARGLDSKVTGGHFNVHIFDDLIDETMVNSEINQNKAIDFIRRSDALFVDIAKDIEIIIGTRWPGPYYDWLLEDSGLVDDYEVLHIGCYVDARYRKFMADIGKKVLLPDGDPIFPEQFPLDALKMVEKRAGPFDFAHQWLNIKSDEDQKRFRKEDFKTYRLNPSKNGLIVGSDIEIAYDELYRTLTIDPATGEHSKTDQSAITVCGLHRPSGRIFVLDVWQDRCLPHALIEKTLEMAEKWKPHVVAPEDVAYQKTFKHFLRRASVERGVRMNIRPVKPGTKGKGARILDSLQPFVRNRQVYVLPMHDKLIKELTELTVIGGKVVGRSPNLADSLAYHAEFWSNAAQSAKDDEDDDIIAAEKVQEPAYGLECVT